MHPMLAMAHAGERNSKSITETCLHPIAVVNNTFKLNLHLKTLTILVSKQTCSLDSAWQAMQNSNVNQIKWWMADGQKRGICRTTYNMN